MRYVGVLGRNEDLLLWAAAVMGVSGFSKVCGLSLGHEHTSNGNGVSGFRSAAELAVTLNERHCNGQVT